MSGVTTPSTSGLDAYEAAVELGDAPEEILLEVLKRLTYADILRAQLLSNRFHRIVKRNAPKLNRPCVDGMILQMRNVAPMPLGHFRRQSLKHLEKRKLCLQLLKRQSIGGTRSSKLKASEVHLDTDSTNGISKILRENLWQFVVRGSLQFDGCTVDDALLIEFTSSHADIGSVKSVSFVLCDFHATSQQLANLIASTSCAELSMEFCKKAEGLVTDQFLSSIKELKSINLQMRDQRSYLAISDFTLDRWASQAELPERVDIHEIRTRFTLLGVLRLITALRKRKETGTDAQANYNWELGEVVVPANQLLLQIQQLSSQFIFQLTTAGPNRFRVAVELFAQERSNNWLLQPQFVPSDQMPVVRRYCIGFCIALDFGSL